MCRIVSLLLVPFTSLAAEAPLPDRPEYNRDIRPILGDACFRCHGFDKNTRKGDRRLDTLEGAMVDNDGLRAIVPGNPAESALLARIHTDDKDDVMPPPEEARQLTAREKALLQRWIEQGAEYQDHWAYIPPVKPAPPAAGHPVDAFINARLAAQGIQPAGEAPRAVLIRRLSFDLTGLPPSAEEVAAFVADTDPAAYEKLVDRLMATEAYAERMAVWWLDQTRFADTIGYHSDNPMPVSPWRDYVIRAFHKNKPFDRFTVEQVAGDLLPQTTMEQRVASAYNRLILSTEEGGAQPGQYEAKYLTDRVKSIGTTWLGQTFMCAECHDHKYDPMTTRDFYALGAFFADIEEVAVGKRGEGIPVFDDAAQAQHSTLGGTIAQLERTLQEPHAEADAAQAAWEKEATAAAPDWAALTFASLQAPEGTTLQPQDAGSILAASGKQGQGTYTLASTAFRGPVAGFKLEALPHDSLPAKGPGRAGNGNFVLTEFVAKVKRAAGADETITFTAARATHEQKSHGEGTPWKGWPAAAAIDGDAKGAQWGWAILPHAGKPHSLYLTASPVLTVNEGDTLTIELRQNHDSGTHGLGHFRISATGSEKAAAQGLAPLPPEVLAVLKIDPAARNDAQRATVRTHFRSFAPQLQKVRDDLAAAKKQYTDIEAAAPRTLVTTAIATPRTVRVLPRGDWQVTSGEVVLPSTPHYLPGMLESTPERRLNRHDLAQWLVSRQNPLTARVFANRLWKLLTGTGIVKTLEDMGTQSELPIHQPLLDWLACEFMDSGWNMKHLTKLMVTSAAYRRHSVASAEALAADPTNREYARGGRWRLDAEFVRDNALAISGLLVRRTGGPSVKPYQPAGYWENLNFPAREWQNDMNENQWRRGLYTWWQRSYVHPAMLAFDAPTREECSPDRTRSNIPQQALVLLNDLTFVESARAFAGRIVREGGSDDAARLRWAWTQATGRGPDEKELATLAALLGSHRAKFQLDKAAAEAALKPGMAKNPQDTDPVELASWLSVARTLLNLHETITRP